MPYQRIQSAFNTNRRDGRPTLVTYLTAGVPDRETTLNALVGMGQRGAGIIELGVPSADPIADGPVIQEAHSIACQGRTTLQDCLNLVQTAREDHDLAAAVVLMGYYNNFYAYGLGKLMDACQVVGVDGLIIVDLPVEHAHTTGLLDAMNEASLAYISLITPGLKEARVAKLVAAANRGFCYVVARSGITGVQGALDYEIPTRTIEAIRNSPGGSQVPTAVGFGVSTRDEVLKVHSHCGADGVIVGSKLVTCLKTGGLTALLDQVHQMSGGPMGDLEDWEDIPVMELPPTQEAWACSQFGGRFIPEILMQNHVDLEAAFEVWSKDAEFLSELDRLRRNYCNGPTPLHFCANLSRAVGGAQIWAKREDLVHTGAHKINNALGQVLLAKKLGKTRIICETGAGQHGVAVASACALLNMKCVVYMGEVDCQRQALNVLRIKVLGGELVRVTDGTAVLKDAVNACLRHWVSHPTSTHYVLGSAVGPDPYPRIVRFFQKVLGDETKKQFAQQAQGLPHTVIACVGGGSNAIGFFDAFIEHPEVEIVGVEAGGSSSDKFRAPLQAQQLHHAAASVHGTPGYFQGFSSLFLQEKDGNIRRTYSISAGLNYPGVGPDHAELLASGRAQYVCVSDEEAFEAFRQLAQTEGIIPALESSHGLAYAMNLARDLKPDQSVVVNISGRGDKDMEIVASRMA